MSDYNPEMDGITHINIYSKGKTTLGQWLSNFAQLGFTHPEDGFFQSVEGYWYWLSCKKDSLRDVYGWVAKAMGRELGGKDWLEDEEFKNKIKQALKCKIDQNVDLQSLFKESNLPFTHYYVYGGKVVNVPKAKWIIEYLEELRKEYNAI